MTVIRDPIAEEYVAMRAEQCKDHEVTCNLASLLVKLKVWPSREYQGRLVPIVPPLSAFKKFYQERRRL